MRMDRFEWNAIMHGLRFVGKRRSRTRTGATRREPDRYETRVAGKRITGTAMTAGEFRSQIKQKAGIKTTAGIIIVNKSK